MPCTYYVLTKDYDRGKAFLAGPGPMHSTASDFWTMIWEKKSYVIVMLGNLQENKEVIKLLDKIISSSLIVLLGGLF